MSPLSRPGLVSVIIPLFNQTHQLRSAVDSVLAQHYRPLEIIFVDTGATGQAETILGELAGRHSIIRCVRQAHSTEGGVMETGRLNARGDYVQFLQAHETLCPGKLEWQVAALSEQPESDVAYGITHQLLDGMDTDTPSKAHPVGVTHMRHSAMFPLMLHERWWSTSTPLYRRRVLDQTGSISDNAHYSSWECDARIASMGGRLAFVNEVVSLVRGAVEVQSADAVPTNHSKMSSWVLAQARVLDYAKHYMTLESRNTSFEQSDWQRFSGNAFSAGRRCAVAGWTTEARALLSLSIKALGKQTMQHRLFFRLVRWFGWRRAAKMLNSASR